MFDAKINLCFTFLVEAEPEPLHGGKRGGGDTRRGGLRTHRQPKLGALEGNP